MIKNIFDGNGRKAGYTNTMSDKVYAHDYNGKPCGYYLETCNTTFDRNGRRYGTGNLVTALLMEENAKRH